jgi:hypothetical protein
MRAFRGGNGSLGENKKKGPCGFIEYKFKDRTCRIIDMSGCEYGIN